eukprot:jgi/Mesvir1/17581/Mv08816-RA.1
MASAAEPMDIDDKEARAKRAAKGKGVAVNLSNDDSTPWVEKYRPKSLSDVASHKEIIDTIGRLTRENRLPHLLLYGPPGTGKTSTIQAVARQIYGAGYKNMTLELNASDDRGIDVVRQQIQDFASTRRIFSSGFKLIILDEADAMTKDAQFSLRRIVEKYTRNTRFCIICNYVSKIIPALQSRCTRFRFPPLGAAFIQSRLQSICDEEKVNCTDEGLQAVVRLCNGDMRRALNILQSTSLTTDLIDEEAVYNCTGSPLPRDVREMVTALLEKDFTASYNLIKRFQTIKGLALVDILREMLDWIFSIDFTPAIRAQLLNAMSDIEYRLAFGTSEKIQLGALVGAFADARKALVEAAK